MASTFAKTAAPGQKVTAADQKLISRFALAHQTSETNKLELRRKANDLQNLNDAADELLLLDDADTASIPMKIGESFIHYDQNTITEKIDSMKQKLEEEIGDLNHRNDQLQTEMVQLKAQLYAKFGDSINLETDKDD